MGLSIELGLLAYLINNDSEGFRYYSQQFTKANKVLEEWGLPIHKEPEDCPHLEFRSVLSYPYSNFHQFRCVFARARAEPRWEPTHDSDTLYPSDYPVFVKEKDKMDSHILCHSGYEGFYFPIDFREVIFDPTSKNRILGQYLGSSYRLMEELVWVAPKLSIHLDTGYLGDKELARLHNLSDNKLEIEKMVWLSLYEAARLSIEYKTAICFS